MSSAVLKLQPTDVAGCREVLAHHAKSFRWAGAFLPARQLDNAAVVYALCRLIDDIADERTSDDEAYAALSALERELRGEASPRALVAMFLHVADTEQVPVEAALELIEGVRYDMNPVLVPDDRALLRYCYRVAGTVGLMMCGVIGVRAASALPFAVDLGVGMQLTNISRDVAEDAGRGRVYLPATRLREVGLRSEQVIDGPRASAAPVVASLLELAEAYYESGAAGMRYIPWRARFAILVASRVYRGIGPRIAAQGFDPDRGRARVSALRKLGWTVRALLDGVALWFRAPTPHARRLHTELDGLPGTHDTVGALPEVATPTLAAEAA